MSVHVSCVEGGMYVCVFILCGECASNVEGGIC